MHDRGLRRAVAVAVAATPYLLRAQCADAVNNKPEHRTGNRGAVPLSKDDTTRYNPWRAPGTAPTFDPCGMAGGGRTFGVEVRRAWRRALVLPARGRLPNRREHASGCAAVHLV